MKRVEGEVDSRAPATAVGRGLHRTDNTTTTTTTNNNNNNDNSITDNDTNNNTNNKTNNDNNTTTTLLTTTFKDTVLSTLRIGYLVPRRFCCVVFSCSAILRIEGCLSSIL